MNAETQRLFIAIPIDEGWRKHLVKQSTLIQSRLPFQKWTHPEDYHITLKFLGDTSVDKLQQIKKILVKVSDSTSPFQLQGKGWGTFGPQAAPSILWVGVGGELDSLINLHHKIEDCLSELFQKENREYTPHLTIARRYNGRGLLTTSIKEYLSEIPELSSNCSVNEIKLYQSHLRKKPMYEPIASFILGKK